jgi:hypothetical protein
VAAAADVFNGQLQWEKERKLSGMGDLTNGAPPMKDSKEGSLDGL